MAESHLTFEAVQYLFIKDFRNESHGLVFQYMYAVRSDNAGAFLSPVLQGIEAEICQLRSFFMSIYCKDAAFLSRPMIR